MVKGSCECKSVIFELDGALQPSIACHCSQCRKTSGHYWSVTEIKIKKFNLLKDSGLKWYSSSEEAKRGFCKECGSSLFFKFNMRIRYMLDQERLMEKQTSKLVCISLLQIRVIIMTFLMNCLSIKGGIKILSYVV